MLIFFFSALQTPSLGVHYLWSRDHVMDISRFIITALALERASVLSTADALETKTNSGPSLSVIILVWVGFCSCILLRSNVHNICKGITITTFYEI